MWLWCQKSITFEELPLARPTRSGCDVRVRSQEREVVVTALHVTCEPIADMLQCRAMGEGTSDSGRSSADLTDVVRWTSSNVNAATIVRGRVVANSPGITTVIASLGSGAETVSSSVAVVVDREHKCPEVGYDVIGAARDLTNTAIAQVELSLIDDLDPRNRPSLAPTTAVPMDHSDSPLKTLWYQLRLLKSLTTSVAPLAGEFKRLETELGEDQNLVVLGATLRGCHDLQWKRAEVRLVEQLALRMRRPIRKRAFALGRRLHRRKPRAFARWLRRASRQRRPRSVAA
jgi:hypothetical protein